MIALRADLKVLVAAQPVDFRNYAQSMIVLSLGGERALNVTKRRLSLSIILRTSGCLQHRQ
jgi:hypothetical protein